MAIPNRLLISAPLSFIFKTNSIHPYELIMASEDIKIKIFRVVTAPEAVNFHLRNTFKLSSKDFCTTVIGDQVEKFKHQYPDIRFINLKIVRKINFASDLIALVKLTLILCREKPRIVHSIMPKAGIISAVAGFIARVPVRIHTFTGQTWVSATGFKRFILAGVDRFIVLMNTRCYTDSESQSIFLLENGILRNGRPLPFLGRGSLSGVDLQRFSCGQIEPNRTQVRSDLGINESDTVFIYLGRKNREKGLFELLNANTKLSSLHTNFKLLLVGPDETDGELTERLKSSSSNVINLPLTDTPEVFLNCSDVFCIPSYREGFGSAVIEAAALKLPSIGSRIPGLLDSIIDRKTGILVPTKDENALFEAMDLLLKDSQLRNELGNEAFKYVVSNFDSKILYKELQSTYYALSKEHSQK